MKHSAPLPAHDLAPAILLHLEPLGARADWQPAHRHTFFEILVLEEAAGDQQLDSQTFPLVDNRLYFIGAGQVHTLRATHLRGWLLAFDPALLDQDGIGTEQLSVATLFSRWRRQPFIDLTADTAPVFAALLLLLRQEYARAQPCPQTLRAYLQALLFNAQRAHVADTGAPVPTAQQTYLERLHELMEQHYSSHHPAAFYAGQLELPLKRLNEYARQALGQSVTQLVHERLLLESKRLLLYSSLTIKEVAYTVGFQEPAYFSRFFKSKTSYYPEQFRRQRVKSPA